VRLRIRLGPALLAALMTTLVHGIATADGGSGYDADVGEVRALFESRQFASLTALLERYQESCDRDIRYEYAAHNGFVAFAARAPSHKALLDEWVRTVPRSWVPLTARATYYKSAGLKARGSKWAKDTTYEQFQRMGDNFMLAVRDLEASLRIRPRQLYAYVSLMEISRNIGDQERGALLAGTALRFYPDSYLVRHCRMISLMPRWDGSYDAMERFAREAAPYAAKNPRLKLLPACIPWERGRLAASDGDYPKAIAFFENALSYGVSWDVLYDLADCRYRAKMYDEALATLDRAMALNPNSAEGHGLRSKIAFARQHLDEALASLERMERIQGLGPGQPSGIRVWESRRLVSDGLALFGKDLPGAIARCTSAIRLHPKNADAWYWRGIANDRAGKPEPALADLRQAMELNPRLFSAYKALDDVLYKQGRLGEIVEAWTRLIELEPGHDNAYVARSGAYSRKKDKASAIQDLTRACGMGNDQACRLLLSLPNGRRR